MDPAAAPLVLIVDDDAAVAKVIFGLLTQAGMRARHAASAEAALEILAAEPIEVVLTDLRMPGADGMELLGTVRREWPEIPVVLLTAHGTVPAAVEAMRRGAFDFLLKPFDRDELRLVMAKAVASAHHATFAPEPAAAASRIGPIAAAASSPMREVDELLGRAARSTATVLLRGESGTGKEVAARRLHAISPRQGGPFVTVHAAALPENLLESELFGHEKGAFTGATARKPGRVELAAGGTLLLDELGDIPLAMQVKLLRLVQEREFQRVGGTQTLHADVRFVAATHRDLERLVAEGRFREDLLFRLNVIEIRLPPLRERPQDVLPLASAFLAELCADNGRPTMELAPEAVEVLAAQPWPGNIRQLRNFIERLVVLCDDPVVGAEAVRRELDRLSVARSAPTAASPSPSAGDPAAPATGASLDDKRRQAERQAIVEALDRSGNNRTRAARILGVGRRTLYAKLHDLGLA